MQATRNYRAGVLGCLAGGVVFGIMLTMLGMMPIIAGLVKSQSVAVGWAVHIAISLVIGLAFVWWFGSRVSAYGNAAGYGLLHGLIWWVLGPLVIMPLMMGMGVQFANMFAKMNMLSLMGHLIFGLLLGLVYFAVVKSKNTATQSQRA